MGEYWAVALTLAGTAYSAYSQNQAVDAANSVTRPAFQPVNIPQIANLAKATDVAGYGISDADYARRFPQLVAGRNYNINDLKNNIGGGWSSQVQGNLAASGNAPLPTGNTFQESRELGKPILSLEQRNRNYAQNLLGDNPQRTAGLSGGDVTKIMAANTGNQFSAAQAAQQSKITLYNAQMQQNMQNQNAAIGGLAGLAGIYSNYQDYKNYSNSPYLDLGFSTSPVNAYGATPPPGAYPGNPGSVGA